ncbi:hypothetical protein KP509_11G063500 [Ceratopteris richardii]|uniref:C2 domain-containing protein n=1 Tax=Ceratopteris richardii TaxID=49495 RepID=A0A8T2TQ25_CERRI|nr:hypothetical protein KP509_11G063500 [Ceratopteris richardii]KAH7425631.1 hypothetical protein KP509_11G063500 [Ceratopteris richardii]KAH7425632.1 hypothetical protein KP509_11G063500 [Ceratopteris richardii]
MALVDIEITLASARDLKNVNWKHGDLRAYVVAWIDDGSYFEEPPSGKIRTEVDNHGDTSPSWTQTLTLTFPKDKLQSAQLRLEVRHDRQRELDGTSDEEDKVEKQRKKALVGKASLALQDVADAGGYGESLDYTVKLKRPSGRPQGKLQLSVRLRERGWAPGTQRGYEWGSGYGQPYPAHAYPPSGYYGGYAGVPPPSPAYGDPYGSYPPGPYPPAPYGGYAPAQPYPAPVQGTYYGDAPPPAPQQPGSGGKGSKFGGLGTGLAVGALAGAVGGLALGEYVDHVEDEAAQEQAEEDAERYAELEAAREEGGYDGDDGDY